MRILLLSAYHAASHALWAEGLMRALPEHDWTLLTLPPRYFRWRVRGNSLSWALMEKATLEADYDLLLATSMTDLSALRGLCPALCALPTVLYFHENQFAYPDSGRQFDSVEPQMLSVYSALAADQLVFNSVYNRTTFFAGAEKLLKKMPDFCPVEAVMRCFSSSSLLPVGIGLCPAPEPRSSSGRLHVVWNHRWEYDKGPERLLAVVEACDAAGVELDLSIVGQQFRQQPREFAKIERVLADSACLALRHWGFVESGDDYRKLLASADVVLSTAIHDFQGLAVLEAVAAGCRPLVPRRLCYPEWFSGDYFYADKGSDIEGEGRAVAAEVQRLIRLKRQGELAVPDIGELAWSSLAPRYSEMFSRRLAEARQ